MKFLVDESVRLFREIERHTYNFDSKEQSIKILAKMIDRNDQEHYNKSKKTVIDYFNMIFFENVKMINIKHIAIKHKEETDTSKESEDKHIKVFVRPI